jgi:hypothetical protein
MAAPCPSVSHHCGGAIAQDRQRGTGLKKIVVGHSSPVDTLCNWQSRWRVAIPVAGSGDRLPSPPTACPRTRLKISILASSARCDGLSSWAQWVERFARIMRLRAAQEVGILNETGSLLGTSSRHRDCSGWPIAAEREFPSATIHVESPAALGRGFDLQRVVHILYPLN